MSSAESPWKLATVLPGALLVAVACSQIYMTQFDELTPSKGGGFGMFAVTDMRSSRTWSVEGITEDGVHCRILIAHGEGALGEWLGAKLRTKPDAAARARAADRIFNMRYVPADYDAALRRARATAAVDILPGDWRSLPLYQTIHADDADREAEPVNMRAIRFQAWRLQFDPRTHRLSSEPIGQPEVRGVW